MMGAAVANVTRILKPGTGKLLFRDYAQGDLAQDKHEVCVCVCVCWGREAVHIEAEKRRERLTWGTSTRHLTPSSLPSAPDPKPLDPPEPPLFTLDPLSLPP